MKNYIKRLRHHPGVPVAAFMTVAFVGADLSNENLSGYWHRPGLLGSDVGRCALDK